MSLKDKVKGCGVLFGDSFYPDMNPVKCGQKERYCSECRDKREIVKEVEKAVAELKKKGRKCEVCPKFIADKCKGVKGKAYWFCGKDFNEVFGKGVKGK